MLKFSIVFEFLLSTNFDWKSESLKLLESLKVGKCSKSEMLSDSKNFFFESSFFLDQVEPKSEKKTKVKKFEKFGHFLLPVLRNKAQGFIQVRAVLRYIGIDHFRSPPCPLGGKERNSPTLPGKTLLYLEKFQYFRLPTESKGDVGVRLTLFPDLD